MSHRFMDIFPSFRKLLILLYPLFIFVSLRQIIFQSLGNTEPLIKCCMWEFQGHKYDKATLRKDGAKKYKNNGSSFLILHISCDEAVLLY